MTPAQKSKYWREWSKVRRILIDLGEFSAADADQERHEIHIRALGSDKSSKELTNRDLDAIFDHFESYLVLVNGPQNGPARACSQPAKRLIWAIEQLCLPDATITHIAHDAYGRAADWPRDGDWRKLPESRLYCLRFTCTRHARTLQKRDSA